jgi:hypothetical protein
VYGSVFQSRAKGDLAAIQQVTLTEMNMKWFRTNVTKIKGKDGPMVIKENVIQFINLT